jgi:hypothetical protein
LDWWQGYSLSFRRSVPMLKSISRLGSEARATDTIHMDTTIRTAIRTTDRIGITATIGLIIGAGIAITATTVILTVIIAIIGNQMT